jgi:hypothetical protein
MMCIVLPFGKEKFFLYFVYRIMFLKALNCGQSKKHEFSSLQCAFSVGLGRHYRLVKYLLVDKLCSVHLDIRPLLHRK